MSKFLPLVQQSDTSAVSQLLTDFYPQVYRLTAALAGDCGAAGILSREVLRRSLRQLPRWGDPSDPQRWFPRMTVLLARQHIEVAGFGRPPHPGSAAEGALHVLTTALLALPPQQREAIVLHYGEGFDPRRLATAMDCSVTAAGNHLAAGVDRLRANLGGSFEPFLQSVPQLLTALVPPAGEVRLQVEAELRRSRWRARLRWALRCMVTLLIVALGYVLVRWVVR